MEEKRLRQAMELFKVPAEFSEAALRMVSEAEWEMILLMGEVRFSVFMLFLRKFRFFPFHPST